MRRFPPVVGLLVLTVSTELAASAAPADLPADWWSEVQQQISDAEYQVTWQGETALPDLESSWQAPNRAHGFRIYFTADGIRVIPRSVEAELAWEWSLSLARWGHAGAPPEALDPARMQVDGNRVEYDRGTLVESYVNDRRGLKHAFRIASAPQQQAGQSLVHLDLALGGTLSPVLSADGQAIDFATPSGAKVVHYAELRVEDATGRVLRSWIEGFCDAGLRGVRIVYDDADAEYPITVDPLATSPAWTAESDQADAFFGMSVSTAGDVNGDGYSDVIVGARSFDNGETREGRAFVYHGSAAGLSASSAWTAESDQADAFFGVSVSTAGDVNGDGYSDVIVGAWAYTNGEAGEGRAFVYHGSAAGLSASPAWTAESDKGGSFFGVSVATAGDINGDGYSDVIVGADSYANGQNNEGRAYVYHGSAAGLSASRGWTAESDQLDAHFGSSVATAGDIDGDGYGDVIVGAEDYDNGGFNEGRVYAYHGSAAGLAATPAWTVAGDRVLARLGSSLAAAGDVNGDGYADVIVGAETYDNGQASEGRVFAYHGSAAGLSTSPAWTIESNQIEAYLGGSAASAGDVNGDGYSDVIVGAPSYDNFQAGEGRAYAYHGSAAGLSTSPAWIAESNQAGATFGTSVATAGDVNGDGYSDVIVGAGTFDNGQTDEGRAFAYHGSAAGLSATPGWTADGEQAGSWFGASVATAGDVNGDGYADVIVGAPLYDNGAAKQGRVFAYHGAAAGPSASPSWTAEGDQAGAWFGLWVATAGDVNGDGYSDVIVGAHALDVFNNPDDGRAFAYHGSAAGLSASPVWTAESDQSDAQFGLPVATAGDVNGDGYSDVVVGAPLYDNGQMNEGRAFVYYGSVMGLAPNPAWSAESDQADARFGRSASTAGDVNGDGYSDVIFGAYLYDNGQSDKGRAFAYSGSAAGLSPSPTWMAETDALAWFGFCVATAGDVNGDGYSDVIVGAHRYSNGQSSEGRAFAYHGSAAGLSASPAWTAESNQANAFFGVSATTAGDVNGDGYSDVIVGASSYDNGHFDEGRAYAYHGSAAGLSAFAAWTAESNQSSAGFGGSASTAGDVNGDGYSDVIVGAEAYADAGRAYLYYGNGGPGPSLHPRQRRVSDAGPIAHLGLSDSTDSFRLNLLGRTPFGRGRVQLESEVEPLGAPLDGNGTEVGNMHDTGTSGVQLTNLGTGLFAATPYHWRVRLRYDPVTTPFAQHSRWLTMPWKGWQETMLRTASLGAASVTGLVIEKGSEITLSWDASCAATDTDYEIYEGTFGDFTSHEFRFCSTGGATTKTFAPIPGDAYYLVVPRNAGREGSYGTDSEGGERPQGVTTCLPQQLAGCP